MSCSRTQHSDASEAGKQGSVKYAPTRITRKTFICNYLLTVSVSDSINKTSILQNIYCT